MNDEKNNKSMSAGTICAIAIATVIIASIMYPFMSIDRDKYKDDFSEPSVVETTESEKTTATEYSYFHEVTTEKKTETVDGFYPQGFYNIGKDIPCGYYILIYNGFDEHGDAGFDVKYTPDESDYSAWVQHSSFVKLDGHGYFELSNCDAYALENFDGENNPFEHSGMFRVGVDVEEGTYRIVPDAYHGNENWCVHENIDSIDYEKLYYNYHTHEKYEVTLHDGEILQLTECKIEKIS